MKFLVLTTLMLMSTSVFSTTDPISLQKSQIDKAYEAAKESTLTYRRFKHSDVIQLIEKHRAHGHFAIQEIGLSAQGRSIQRLAFGSGPKAVMLWSQMHGDEATATMALFDLFNFLKAEHDGFDPVRKLIKEQTSLYFIPMLNPDGAELFQRRTAMNVDMNRDARAGKTIEGALLKAQAMSLKPQYAFNLHDQNSYYNVPGTKTPVSISLLAPAFNQARAINPVREGAMQIIAGMNRLLKQYIPNAIAKYDDEYTPRGFGDNFQSWGASTVLIESGAFAGDPEKMEIRKLNFAIILNALVEIAQGSYKNYAAQEYHDLPFNASQLHDLVLRDITVVKDGHSMAMDIAVRRTEVTQGRDYYVKGMVEDLGDLQDFYGYEEVTTTGLNFVEAKEYPAVRASSEGFTPAEAFAILKQGYASVRCTHIDPQMLHSLPLLLTSEDKKPALAQSLAVGSAATFFLAQGEQLKYAVVNGYLIDLSQEMPLNFKNKVN